MDDRPKLNAPGLVWRRLRNGWLARWQCRTDIRQRGYRPAVVNLWHGAELDKPAMEFIADRCRMLQDDMLVWSRGGVPLVATFDGTLVGLISSYRSHADSGYQNVRYRTRKTYDSHCERLAHEHGDDRLSAIKGPVLLQWHREWAATGHVAQAHALVGMMRTLMTFGFTILENADCERISSVLHRMRFPQPPARKEALTAEQATAIRRQAHAMGYPSIALAQALQFDGLLRQRDVIGEWVPLSEPGISDVTAGQFKWLRGIRWEEIDGNLILRHVTSKRGKTLELDLKLAPMVMEEIAHASNRGNGGPVIIREKNGLPWSDHDYRRYWRAIANKASVPRHVRNMDSRAGGITEASDAGAELEHIRHAATHSNIATTQRYSRGSADKAAAVLKLRVEHRNRSKT